VTVLCIPDVFFFFFFDGTTVQWGTSPPKWDSPSERISNYGFIISSGISQEMFQAPPGTTRLDFEKKNMAIYIF